MSGLHENRHDEPSALRAAVIGTSQRLVALLSTVRDPSVTAVGHWTIADLAIHLTETFERYPRYLRGEVELMDDPLDVTQHNNEVVAAGRGLPVDEATHRIASAVDEIDGLLADRSPDEPVRWHGGIELAPAAFAAVIGSEAVVHGYDLSSPEGRYSPCERSDAAPIMANALHLLPHYLNKGAAGGLSATFDMRFRGGERRLLTLDDGVLAVSADGEHADCVVLADPETFLLVGYNRIGQWRPALTGKILTWGRKPWLALKLPQLLAQI